MKKKDKPKAEGLGYPPSVQHRLLGYLNGKNRETVRGILAKLRPRTQILLAASLLDYIESGMVAPADDDVVQEIMFYHIIKNNIVKPLNIINI